MTINRCWRSTATVALLVFAVASASAQTTLFTTVEDFTDWENSTTQDSVDLDGSSTNGLAGGGVAGTAGSLALLPSSNYNFHFSPGQQGNAELVSALGIGGEFVFEHDFPTPLQAGSYFQLGVGLNYNDHFDQLFGATVDNMDGTYTTTVPYTFDGIPADGGYLQIGIIYNAELSGVAVTVDNIRVQNTVPEPATMGSVLLGLVVMGLGWRKTR